MLMRGDMQKIIDHINPVFKTAFDRIEALEKRLEELEKPKAAPKAKAAPKKETEPEAA